MADLRAPKSGINADTQKKLDEEYDEDLEYEIREWLELVIEEPFPEPDPEALEAIIQAKGESWKGATLYASLRDGSYLCKLIRKLDPNSTVPSKFEKPSKQVFRQRESIGGFLTGCKEFGVSENSLFETESLHGACNLNMVLTTIVALGTEAQSKEGYNGPPFGPKKAEPKPYNFSQEKLAEGKSVIGLQMGSNQGASQSGMTPYGLGRQIHN